MLGVADNRGEVGILNRGFGGVAVEAGKKYDFTVFARQISGVGGPLTVRLETPERKSLGEVYLNKPTSTWNHMSAVLEPNKTANNARLVILSKGIGRVALDMVSLFPQDTFRGRKNGLRKDVAQTIADLKPKFVRFPGGCLVHGDGLDNMYRWQDSVGPVHQRKSQRNIWTYHQSLGLGYFEYFQFCEDIGAKPVPVVPAGVCCQNAGARVTGKWGEGQRGIPMQDMPEYIQQVLDLIEYANGPADSKWGKVRAEAGHPEPFGLEYLGIGNEDRITPEFEERFAMIHDAVDKAHPEITIIGTVGPFPEGTDYEAGWKIANRMHLDMVDEHYYRTPEWFLNNLNGYDGYIRNRSAVYSNFIDVPTDCPQRDERLGWTGDAQVYVSTACLNTDSHAFFRKWLVDLVDAQRADGQFPMVAPLKVAGDDGGPAWADAGVICPWTVYNTYGDERLLADHYPSMKRFVRFCRHRSKDNLLPPDEFHCFGDWLSIKADTPKEVIYTAYFAHCARLLAQAATVLGHGEDAQQYAELFAKIKRAFNEAYVQEDGKIHGDTQCCYVLALANDLLDEPQRQLAAEHLVSDITARDYHLSLDSSVPKT